MTILNRAIEQAKAVSTTARDGAYRVKASGGVSSIMTPAFSNPFGAMQGQARNNERYSHFRSWVYAAINAIALEASAQPVNVGKVVKETKGKKPKDKKSSARSSMLKAKMPTSCRMKAADNEMELMPDHPLLEVLAKPNPMQGRSQFVYSFIANLCLTGWAYVVREIKEDGTPEYYSLPTTWIKVDHKEGPFSRFRIVDPKKPEAAAGDEDWLTREQVGFAHLPNPADPMGATAPASSQIGAIRINDHIQTSREQFFNNGIFPSVIVTVGKDPHPDVPGGIRPRLTNAQRRQVHSVIQKTMGGVSNYGMPAIVDGLIESITRHSMTDSEMGWEKSEASVKSSILSAFCVHPYLIGEAVSVGGYAQVANIEKRFYKRVNAYLDMLSGVITALMDNDDDGEDNDSIVVWWEQCEATDPTREDAMLRFARSNNDISQNELRAKLGYGPDEDRSEQRLKSSDIGTITGMLAKISEGAFAPDQATVLLVEMGIPEDIAKTIVKSEKEKEATVARNPLLSTVGGMNGAVALLSAMGQGAMSAETAAKLIALFFEIPEKDAKAILASTEEMQNEAKEKQEQQPEVPPENPLDQMEPEEEEEEPPVVEETEDPFAMKEAVDTLKKALEALSITPEQVADDILNRISGVN